MFLLIRIKLHSGSDLAIPKTVSRPIPDDVPVIRTVRVILKEQPLKQIFYIALVNYMFVDRNHRMQSIQVELQRVFRTE